MTEDNVLVYFGAGWDFKPVNKKLYKKFNHFIFIDALPDLIHYEPGMPGYEKSKDNNSFLTTLKKTAYSYKLKLQNIDGDLLTFANDEIKLEYHINTTVQKALADLIIRKKINEAKWLHVEGFYPHDYGLNVGDLPNLIENVAELRKL